jgi:lysophospholipase L1-like esterase
VRKRAFFVIPLLILLVAGAVAWREWRQPTSAARPEVYVALGASDAVGVGAARPDQDGWAPLVQQGLPDRPQLVNLGVSGATLADVLAEQAPVAADAGPRWVTIWPGPNDLRAGVPLDTFTAQLNRLLDDLAPPPGQQRLVMVVNLPDLRLLPIFAQADGAQLDAQVRQWNAVIAAAVARHQAYAMLVDLYSGWAELAAHPDYISADGFHPSSAGYRRLADLVLDTLRHHA